MKPRSISIAILALFIAAIAIAQPGPGPRPPQKAVAEYLQLSDQQVTTWQQIQKDTAATVQPLAENARDLHKQIETALEAATPDPAAVGKLAVELHAVQEKIRAAHEAGKAKRVAVLNADQKAKFEAFEAAAAFLRQERRGPGGPGRGMRRGAMPPR